LKDSRKRGREGMMPAEDIVRSKLTGNTLNGGRAHLASLFAELGYTKGAEIGVQTGKYSIILCKTIPNLKLICVDPWGIPRIDRRSEERYQHCVETLSPYGTTFIRMTSIEASKLVPDGSLDFVYIDALHDFDNAMIDITLWAPKVRAGGIVSGHDYISFQDYGVIQAVDAYTQIHKIDYYVTQPDLANKIFYISSWFWLKK